MADPSIVARPWIVATALAYLLVVLAIGFVAARRTRDERY